MGQEILKLLPYVLAAVVFAYALHHILYKAMPDKHPKRHRDLNQWAKHMVDLATSGAPEPAASSDKDPLAVELG